MDINAELVKGNHMEKGKFSRDKLPVLGIISTMMPLFGFLGILAGSSMHSWKGIGTILLSSKIAPVIGILCALIALAREERWVAAPITGLTVSLGFGVYCWIAMP